MPTYNYECEKCGKATAEVRRISERNDGPTCCGRKMSHNWVADHKRGSYAIAQWPLVSDAMGVHPSQVDEAQKQAIDAGISVRDAHFVKDGPQAGCVVVTKRGRKQMMKMLGWVDRASYD